MSFDLGAMLKDVSNLDTKREQIEYIRLDRIDADPNNFYQIGGIEDLAANIALCGLQQPIRVRQKPDDPERYVTVSGHRRRAALEQLAKDDPERWAEVPCIVERDTVSPALQQLRLIYANANTRTMTSAELGEQAAQVEKLLYQLKEEGYEFPGRMRDHVAEAVNASKTKLARLKVIRSKLIPQFMRMWEKNELNETVAYALASQVPVRQNYIYILAANEGKSRFVLTADTLNYRFKIMDEIQKKCDTLSCKTGKKCGHTNIRMQRVAGYGYVQCSGCCISCPYLLDCSFNCPDAADKKSRLKAKAKSQRDKEIKEKREKEKPEKDLLSTAYSRVSQLRKERNVSAEDFVKASLGFAYDRNVKRLNEIEEGKTLSLQDRMPGGIWANEAKSLIATADLLGCSIDYLLGRDVSNLDTKPVSENVSNLDTGWRTGTPDTEGEYIVLVKFDPKSKWFPDKFEWSGGEWLDHDMPVADIDVIVGYWMPVPDDEKQEEPEVDSSPASCKTGISDSGLCGSAAYCTEPFDCCAQCAENCNVRCGFLEKEG